ncbi:nicotinate-nucleotide adenylyltransferase [Acetobacterium tundrae]|uniref:Probable nicotinate-nucleotide adenylyltransferase n=1 Tax=Acetobacterium tundrae TaxID=132932 RepID=A0ABR6WN99_9FIRM|nr:nicotinate-nucleotide adenylyltransferase [Acetobacterium tundrae]MBC3797973.1 nicotinate-nucleotide adenylyltransferase [Acetobacterium tundrae]
MKEKIGLLGGTFNPIHTGHLLLAESARDQYKLDKVLFIPTGNNPFKLSQDEISKGDRLKMVELAIASNPYFETMTYEIDQNGLTYTIDTVNKIKEIYPDSDLYFIAGADLMFEITLWKGASELLKAVIFITTFRPGYSHENLDIRIKELREIYGASIFKLCTTEMAIASSDIRSRIRNGYSIRYLLPETVEKHIYVHQLYLTKSRTESKK